MTRTTAAFALLIGILPALLVARPGAAGAENRANIALNSSNVSLTQTSNTQWTLTKTGSSDATTVTWQVQATPTSSTWGRLAYNGLFTFDNRGTAPATIGNVVVNLQTRSGSKWVTRSSVVADATQDDGAISANVSPKGSSEGRTFFAENAASGRLLLTDAATNSVFALVPQVMIPAGATTTLLLTASFDNNVLSLPVGTATRAEIIVSFGNAKTGSNSSPNVDISGNGIVDPDEAWVQSVADRPLATVPAETPSNETVTLSDSESDITTTGTVTFSNPVINLNQATHSGTVVVSYNGGTAGGTITNCAHLTGSGQTQTFGAGSDAVRFENILAVNLTACDTQVVGPQTCPPGTVGCGWKTGDIVSWGQSDWGDDPATNPAAANLESNFGVVYPFSAVEVGISGVTGFSMIFTSSTAILRYLPQGGAPLPLNADLLDPSSSASGASGGAVLAMRLDIDFADRGFLPNNSGLQFGDLRVCNLPQTSLNGMTIRELMAFLNTALGGGSTGGFTYDELYAVAENASSAFTNGAPTSFAQQHIFSGSACACTPGAPGCGWKDGDIVSYGQSDWGDDPATNPTAANLGANFGTVYPFSVVEIGTSGLTGFSMIFTSGAATLNYIPQGGNPSPLTADLLDPTLSTAGVFGGAVLAMRLDIDFSDAGFLPNASGLRFGDLRLCNLPQASLNGMTVRQFMTVLNTALGGGTTGGFTYDELYAVAENASGAFTEGFVTPFAQQYLFNGACP